MSKKILSHSLFLFGFATVVGQLVPLLFISFELMELGLTWTFDNVFDIYNSQLIYSFSSISVSGSLFTVLLLFKRISSQRIFLNTILDGMSEHIIVLNSDFKPTFKNFASKSSTQIDINELLKFKERTDSFEWSIGEGNSHQSFICCFSLLKDPAGTLLIMKDISEIKTKDELLKSQEQSMISSSRLASLGEMAADLAHEINNPLAVIIGRVEMIRSQMSDGSVTDVEISNTLAKIHDMAFRISKIVTSMRKTSKASSQSDMVATNLNSVIEDIMNISSEKVRNSLINLDYSGVNKDLKIEVNFFQLSQVIFNLINNSIDELEKLPEERRNIWFSTEEFDGQVILKIRDSGLGIPLAVRTKEIGKGNGLGLSISKSLMVAMGGDLELSPEISPTCFILKFRKKDCGTKAASLVA